MIELQQNAIYLISTFNVAEIQLSNFFITDTDYIGVLECYEAIGLTGNDINITNSVLNNNHEFTPSLISVNEVETIILNKLSIHNKYSKDVPFISIKSLLRFGNKVLISECTFD